MPSLLPALIFDLDGTLTDSKPGILSCLRKVLDERGMGDCGPLERFIGPPVEEWAAELLERGSEEERAALVNDYRACYGREGWNNNSVFAGVREMLTQLHEGGFALYVCTSKAQHYAIRILELFELGHYFAGIYGDKPEYADHSKQMLLGRLLAEQALTSECAYMIGDRKFDFDAARVNGVPSIAAGWGYGSAEEFAQADALAATPTEIFSLLEWRLGATSDPMVST